MYSNNPCNPWNVFYKSNLFFIENKTHNFKDNIYFSEEKHLFTLEGYNIYLYYFKVMIEGISSMYKHNAYNPHLL